MTKAEIMNKIKEIIGDEDKWLTLLLEGEYVGTINLSKADKESDETILDKIEIQRNGDGTFSLWFNHDYGYCHYCIDNCKVSGL